MGEMLVNIAIVSIIGCIAIISNIIMKIFSKKEEKISIKEGLLYITIIIILESILLYGVNYFGKDYTYSPDGKAYRNEDYSYRYIDKIISETKKEIPIRIDEYLTLIDMKREDNIIFNSFKLSDLGLEFFKLEEDIVLTMKNLYCNDTNIQSSMNNGLAFSYQYFDSSMVLIENFAIDKNDCKSYQIK
ncbi:MAG: hypothetical protein N4A43_04025 [Alphaproteobacteria bacterium]|jgi:hypothetical protein|nr:hypothetical protein [Alphaproteobacteria bacterium]